MTLQSSGWASTNFRVSGDRTGGSAIAGVQRAAGSAMKAGDRKTLGLELRGEGVEMVGLCIEECRAPSVSTMYNLSSFGRYVRSKKFPLY